MPQTISPAGILLGNSVFIFQGAGNPNNRTDPDILAAGVGSLYLQTDATTTTTVLWVCTSAGVAGAFPTSLQISPPVWTNK